MSPHHTPSSLNTDDLNRPLTFWENGPIRQILEMEFDAVFEQEVLRREVSVSGSMYALIHDAVIPEAFLFFTKNVRWTEAEEKQAALAMIHEKPVRRELLRSISRQLDQIESLLPPTKGKMTKEHVSGWSFGQLSFQEQISKN